MPSPFADSPNPSDGPYGWIVAAAVAVISAAGGLWAVVRKGRQEDSTTALTHANNIIKGHERYAERRDKRIVELENEIQRLWKALGDTADRERLCLMRVEWLCSVLREHDINIPPWPFGGGSDE